MSRSRKALIFGYLVIRYAITAAEVDELELTELLRHMKEIPYSLKEGLGIHKE